MNYKDYFASLEVPHTNVQIQSDMLRLKIIDNPRSYELLIRKHCKGYTSFKGPELLRRIKQLDGSVRFVSVNSSEFAE